MRSTLFIGPAVAAVALAAPVMALPLGPSPQPIACRTSGGPCRFLDSVTLVGRGNRADIKADDLFPVVNFGFLTPALGKGWQFVCEESLGVDGPLDRVVRHPDGRILVPSRKGLHLASDGCGYENASGSILGLWVRDLAIDPGRPARVLALTSGPRAIHVSDDGGRTFVRKAALPEDVFFDQLLLSASNPQRVFVGGLGPGRPVVLAVSDDGGDSVVVNRDPVGLPPGELTVDYVTVDPSDANTVYISWSNLRDADEIWRTRDAGRSWERVLALKDIENKSGFAFGPKGKLFVAGTAALANPDQPSARLYSSDDDGRSWKIKESGAAGPRYRCLGWGDGRLWACAAGEKAMDAFLVGSSVDEGQTWQAAVTAEDLVGPRPCAATACVATSTWLCDTYKLCAPGARPAPLDAGPVPPPVASPKASGCGCRVGASRSTKFGILPMISGVIWVLYRRRPRHQRSQP